MVGAGPIDISHARGGTWTKYKTITASNGMWVGATTTDAAGNSPYSTFTAANQIIGPLRTRRTFIPPTAASSFPATIGATPAGPDYTAGSHVWLSMKPNPVSDVVAGAYDTKLTSLAQSITGGYPHWFTMWHEFEGNSSGTTPFFANPADFVAMFQHFYTVVKTANPNITVGPVHMTYQWGNQSGANVKAGHEDDWWVGSSFADFIGADTYWDSSWEGPQTELSKDPSHLHWHNWAAAKGKDLYIVERGVRLNGSVAAAVLNNDEIWLQANGYKQFMYWDAMGTGSLDWRIDTDPYMSVAWQQIAGRGRSS